MKNLLDTSHFTSVSNESKIYFFRLCPFMFPPMFIKLSSGMWKTREDNIVVHGDEVCFITAIGEAVA